MNDPRLGKQQGRDRGKVRKGSLKYETTQIVPEKMSTPDPEFDSRRLMPKRSASAQRGEDPAPCPCFSL